VAPRSKTSCGYPQEVFFRPTPVLPQNPLGRGRARLTLQPNGQQPPNRGTRFVIEPENPSDLERQIPWAQKLGPIARLVSEAAT